MSDLIDTHAHVWNHTCPMAPGRRYTPGYTAPVEAYLRMLDRHRVARAVLVQPSFLGTDNRYLRSALRAWPDRLRGIVVVDPSVSDMALDDLTADGVIGLRYNLIGQPAGQIAADPYRQLTLRTAGRGWWIEVQASGTDWPAILPAIGQAPLMVDHFARPASPDCSGLAAILARTPERTLVKFSAPYRQTLPDLTGIARRFLDRFGPAGCTWGSDWPWTGFEGQHLYGDTLAWFTHWTGTDPKAIPPHRLGFEARTNRPG